MKWLSISFIAFIVSIMSAIAVTEYVSRNKPYVPTAEDIFTKSCIERGGEPLIKKGWSNDIYTQDYSCRSVE